MRGKSLILVVLALCILMFSTVSANAAVGYWQLDGVKVNSVAALPAWGGTGSGWIQLQMGATPYWYEIQSKEMLAIALTAYSTSGYVSFGATSAAEYSMIENLWIADAP